MFTPWDVKAERAGSLWEDRQAEDSWALGSPGLGPPSCFTLPHPAALWPISSGCAGYEERTAAFKPPRAVGGPLL